MRSVIPASVRRGQAGRCAASIHMLYDIRVGSDVLYRMSEEMRKGLVRSSAVDIDNSLCVLGRLCHSKRRSVEEFALFLLTVS